MARRGGQPSPSMSEAVSSTPRATDVRDWVQSIRNALDYVCSFGRARSAKATYTLPKPWPGVLPPEIKKAPLAMDSQIQASFEWFGQDSCGHGYGFMGYARLSDLAQVPEYRRPSEILANEMTRKWLKIVSTSTEDKTETIKRIEEELDRIKAQEIFRRAFELDNFFGKSQIYPDLGMEGDELKTPLILESKVKKNSLKSLRVIEPIWTYPNNYNSIDPTKEDFYNPQTWFVLGQEIHASRMMMFRSRPVSDLLKPAYLFGGVSLTQLLKPYVDNWLRTRQSVSNITHNFSTMVFLTDLSQMTQPGGQMILAERAELFNATRDNQGAFIADKIKEDIKNISAPLGSLDKLQAQAQEQMAAIAGIPLVKYFGITPSGLNASSDGEIRCFYDTIESVQQREGTPAFKRLLDIIQMSLFGKIDPTITFQWEPLWSLDEEKQANVRKVNAEIDCAYVDHQILSQEEVRKTIASEEDSRYASIDVENLPEPLELPGQEVEEKDDEATPDLKDAPAAELRHAGEKIHAAE